MVENIPNLSVNYFKNEYGSRDIDVERIHQIRAQSKAQFIHYHIHSDNRGIMRHYHKTTKNKELLESTNASNIKYTCIHTCTHTYRIGLNIVKMESENIK